MIKFSFTNKKQQKAPNIDLYDKRRRFRCLSDDSPFAIKEAYNALRANLLYMGDSENCPVIAVTSAEPNEGKTLNAVNTAIAFAHMGKRVLLIDGDMRNSSIPKYIELKNKNGLSEYLAGLCPDPEIQQTPIDGLCVLTAGRTPPNPSELLYSEGMSALLEKARAAFDIVFIDTPPVNVVSDSLSLSNKVKGYLLVVRAGESEKPSIKQVVEKLNAVNGRVLGFVLNDVNPKTAGVKGAYGKYGKYGKYSKYSKYSKYGGDT